MSSSLSLPIGIDKCSLEKCSQLLWLSKTNRDHVLVLVVQVRRRSKTRSLSLPRRAKVQIWWKVDLWLDLAVNPGLAPKRQSLPRRLCNPTGTRAPLPLSISTLLLTRKNLDLCKRGLDETSPEKRHFKSHPISKWLSTQTPPVRWTSNSIQSMGTWLANFKLTRTSTLSSMINSKLTTRPSITNFWSSR